MASPVRRLAAAGHEVEYLSIPAARRGLPTLVFLHEGLGSLALWRDVPTVLAARTGCAALVYSRYGNGFSEPLREGRLPHYMHDEALLALPALLGALGIAETVLVGHSDGASIALIHAAEYPDRVRALVLEAPHLFVEDLSVASIAAIKGEYEKGELRRKMARHHADVDRTFYGWNDVWLSRAFRDWNIEPLAGRVRAPVLAIQGLDDEYGTLSQLRALEERARGSVDRLLLAGCGHAPHRDRSELVLCAMSAWLSERLCA
jgi:pimeloyl-ACP methyl ester carboxylesterase